MWENLNEIRMRNDHRWVQEATLLVLSCLRRGKKKTKSEKLVTPLFCTFKRTYPVYSRWFPSFVVVDNETWESISKKWMLLKRPSWNELQTLSMALTYHYRAHCGLLAQLHIGYRSSLFADTFRFDSQICPQIPVIDGKFQRRTSPTRRSEKHSVSDGSVRTDTVPKMA